MFAMGLAAWMLGGMGSETARAQSTALHGTTHETSSQLQHVVDSMAAPSGWHVAGGWTYRADAIEPRPERLVLHGVSARRNRAPTWWLSADHLSIEHRPAEPYDSGTIRVRGDIRLAGEDGRYGEAPSASIVPSADLVVMTSTPSQPAAWVGRTGRLTAAYVTFDMQTRTVSLENVAMQSIRETRLRARMGRDLQYRSRSTIVVRYRRWE